MALLPGRNEIVTDISYFAFATMTRGVVVVASGTPGSGEAMDSAAQAVEVVNNPSGARKPVGLLLSDVVNYDLARQPVNWLKNETQVGNKVPILKKGWVCTDAIMPNQATGNMPTEAYLGTSGNLTDVQLSGYPQVGRFMSRKDSNGFAKVFIDLA